MPEFHVHVTVPPLCTAVSRGAKRLLLTLTPTAVDGPDPISVNAAAFDRPATPALTVWTLEEPSEQVGVSTPCALVVLSHRLTPPHGTPQAPTTRVTG